MVVVVVGEMDGWMRGEGALVNVGVRYMDGWMDTYIHLDDHSIALGRDLRMVPVYVCMYVCMYVCISK